MAKVTIKKSDIEGFYSGAAGEFRINIDRTGNNSPRSIDLVLLGLGACTISTVAHYLRRKRLPQDNLAVELSADLDEKGNIYKNLTVLLRVDDQIPQEIRKVLVGVAKTCRIHRTLESRPHVAIELAELTVTSVSRPDLRRTATRS
jgi:putative redox protein